tara:strand:+ start:368 stop:1570 length:1203 start_codon:yes stop_codon:yes gene_type:complete
MKIFFFIIFFITTLLQSSSYSDEENFLKTKDLEEYLFPIEITDETPIEVLDAWVLRYDVYSKVVNNYPLYQKYRAHFCGGEWSEERDPCFKELSNKSTQIRKSSMRAKILLSKAMMDPEYKAAVEKLRKKKVSAENAEDNPLKKVIEDIKNQIISLGGDPDSQTPGESAESYIKRLLSQKSSIKSLLSQKKAAEQKNIEDKIKKEKAAKKSKEPLAERCKKEKERGTITMECAEYKDPSQMETAFNLKCNLEGKTFYTKSNVSITHLIEFKLYKSDGKIKLIAFLDNTEVRPWNLSTRIGDADYSSGQRNENDPKTIFPGGFTFISFEVPIDMRPLHLDGGADPVSIFFDVSLEKAIKQKVGNFYMRSYMTKINREIPDSSAKGTRPHPDYIQGNNCKIY